jgi:nucleotide-binding universal stress UspA family protein
MNSPSISHPKDLQRWSAAGVFSRILCGVDGSEPAYEAVRQAARLAPHSAEVTVSSIWNTGSAVALGWAPVVSQAPTLSRARSEAAVAEARALLPAAAAVETAVIQGPPAPMMVVEARRRDATLVAVGGNADGRLTGVLLGSVATQLLHLSPCPVLIARPPLDPGGFPRTIVVATDGSYEASRAVAVGVALAGRLKADLEAVVVTGDGDLDRDSIESGLPRRRDRRIPLRRLEGSPVAVLQSLRPDLLIVGSRGLRGLRSLGSVSERVAHGSDTSVLVVR